MFVFEGVVGPVRLLSRHAVSDAGRISYVALTSNAERDETWVLC